MSGPFPEGSAERKTYPVHSVCSGYFPAAIAAVAHHSYLGNEKHNPGQDLHWARGKSDDHLEAAMRHLIEGDLVGAAWRCLAALQLQCEAQGAPKAPMARYVGEYPEDNARKLRDDAIAHGIAWDRPETFPWLVTDLASPKLSAAEIAHADGHSVTGGGASSQTLIEPLPEIPEALTVDSDDDIGLKAGEAFQEAAHGGFAVERD